MSDRDMPVDRRKFLGGAGTIAAAGGAVLIGSAGRAEVLASATSAKEQSDEQVAISTVDALEGTYGIHPGHRRNHTKGVGALGSFIGNPEFARFSRSRLFSGEAIEAVSRFSIAGGDPEVADADRSPRGLAIEFRLPDGSLHHMTMLNTPMFFARVPKTFLDKFVALTVDPVTGKSNPAALASFLKSHPDTTGQVTFLNQNNPPRSYAEEAYFGIHTFFLVDRDGQRRKAKFHFQPRDGIHRLTASQMASAPKDFLEAALVRRLRQGVVEWDLVMTIGEQADEERDPTVLWPADRPQFKAGVLRLHSAVPSEQAGSFKINYDPMLLADGIEASDDPVLLFRSPSYAVSHGRRLRES